ncbi:Uncharacterised protein [[Flavobacterium] thermophilum]|nr:hypothetical protein GARCT_00887 [Geobacillus sp. 12AMOR1]AKM18216.1 hypothetical protein GARCT_00921 [Geobacillus sp. 12AMOR1]STO11390.1 Uncharacterised protein [[Flavobacterium] thermophilum]STO36111.1 Uncharacterised protein [[Flavobacterium] thermophilum]
MITFETPSNSIMMTFYGILQHTDGINWHIPDSVYLGILHIQRHKHRKLSRKVGKTPSHTCFRETSIEPPWHKYLHNPLKC